MSTCQWEPFNIYDEEKREKCSIFCDDCGLKNRGDTGWIIKRNKKKAAYKVQAEYLLGGFGMNQGMQQHNYMCEYCVKAVKSAALKSSKIKEPKVNEICGTVHPVGVYIPTVGDCPQPPAPTLKRQRRLPIAPTVSKDSDPPSVPESS